jgi:hypothetical protein
VGVFLEEAGRVVEEGGGDDVGVKAEHELVVVGVEEEVGHWYG